MLDSIYIGTTGLIGHQQGLRVIANNTANLNTPGYKSATLQFADLFYASTPSNGRAQVQLGHGLGTAGTRLDFRPGDLRQTGNELDLALDGEGFFQLRDAQGQARYTRAGQFQFDVEGILVNRADGSQVQGLDAGGKAGAISLAGLQVAPGQATSVIRFTGNLSTSTTAQTVGSVQVFDALGEEHALSLQLTSTDSTTPGSWKVELMEGGSAVGTSEIVFADGHPPAETAKLAFTYTPPGRAAQQLTLDFSTDVTAFAAGNLSTLAMSSQDGHAPANLAKVSFDASGTLVATYANGQTRKGARLALARFSTPEAAEALGGSLFGAAAGFSWQSGVAGEGGFGAVKGGMLEMSNVDLSREFSDLVVMQRGYQAASQVVATANDMLQELFGMTRK